MRELNQIGCSDELLRLEAVCCRYRTGQNALGPLDLTLKKGERIAVLGANGAGKSTLLLCCNGVLPPAAGQVLLDGRPVGHSRRELDRLRRNVGLVFQEPENQILAGTVEAEVSFGPLNLGLSEAEVLRRVDAALGALELEPLRRRPPHYLSGGEKKRVTLADVLAMEPRLLLLDEPAAGLDPAGTARLHETLDQLWQRGMTLMLSTHNVDFAWRWASRVLLFSGGRLVADGSPEDVFAREELVSECRLEQPLLRRVGQLLGLRPLPRTPEQLEALCKAAGWAAPAPPEN